MFELSAAAVIWFLDLKGLLSLDKTKEMTEIAQSGACDHCGDAHLTTII